MLVNLGPRGRLIAFFVLAMALGWMLYALPLFGLGTGGNLPISPVLAAVIVVALTQGRAGLGVRLGRCLRWRTSPGWYVLAIGFSYVALPVAAVLAVALGAAPLSAAALSEWVLIPVGFVIMFIFVGIGEEWGWTGFALPELAALGPWWQQVGILAILRMVWHVPLLFTADGIDWPVFVLIFGAQFLWATAFRHSGGLVMVVACWHASLNSVGGEFLSPMFVGPDSMTFSSLWVLAYLLLIAVVLYRYRADFSSAPAPQPA